MALPEVPDWTQLIQLMGQYDGTPTLVAVDANGNIVAIMKGEYAGTPKTLATDADGRLIAILTDPEDVSGIFRQMGFAEHAARTGPFIPLGRRGDIVWWDDFEGGYKGYASTANASGLDPVISTAVARSGAYSLKLYPDTTFADQHGFSKRVPIVRKKGVGFEISFTVDGDESYHEFLMDYYDGTNKHPSGLRVYPGTNDLQYLDNGGSWQSLGTTYKVYSGLSGFNTIKLVADFENDTYLRALLNSYSEDLDAHALQAGASAVVPQLIIEYKVVNPALSTVICYVDDLVITQNEPANA